MPINRTVLTRATSPAANAQAAVNITAASFRNTRTIRLLNLEAAYTGSSDGNTIHIEVIAQPSGAILLTVQQPGSTAVGGRLVRNYRDGMRLALPPGDTSLQVASSILIASSGLVATDARSHGVNFSFVLD